MNEMWGAILVVHLIGVIFWFAFSAIGFVTSDYWRDIDGKRDCARCILATPVWPLGVLFFIWLGARAVWRSAFDK